MMRGFHSGDPISHVRLYDPHMACPLKSSPRFVRESHDDGRIQERVNHGKDATRARADHREAAGNRGAYSFGPASRAGGTQRGDRGANVLSLAKGVRWYEADQAKRLRELEKENAQLKKLVADLSLDKQMLQEITQGNF